ncbi:carboxylesterase [Amycolatopsis sp. NBRC 101858]|uniref:alpha/beta hydrolase fold domain-containing protein n=1 Tax=Amycolatopsis sp. NBRC 101858 TaxID=3032200 RepID=UPI0024A0E016|nr:alpha/beta hydrolase fold domain-containing protein [Amycolatopsis sp. NBRC 101858]GLY43177.1 carboxylesterase [Amycolatopsis sp. NBRC 101858]
MSILSKPFVADGVARLMGAAAARALKPRPLFPEIPGRTTEIAVPTRHGPMPATLYRPREGVPAKGVYVNAHGGGFVVGGPIGDDPLCRYLAEHAGVFVVNVDYALAPARRFPVPCEQVFDALAWAAAPEREWAGARLCVGGQSAGGSLAAAASRLALREGGPEIAVQVLHYPPLDLVTPAAAKPASPGVVIRPWMGEVFDTAYIPDAARRTDPLASPAWGSNGDGLAGIAPALVITCEHDRLRAEAVTYAGKLAEAGALVEHYDIRGVDHGYDLMGGEPELVRRVYAFLALHVERAVSG